MRRSLRSVLIGSAAALATGVTAFVVWPAHAEATSAITNPGFESGLTGWSCASTVSAGGGHARSGAQSLIGATTGADHAKCSQTVTVAPSTKYTLSAYVNGTYVFLGATGTGGTDPSVWTPGTSGSYQPLTATFSTGASTTSITVTLNGWYGQGTYYADDLALTGPGGGSTVTPTTVPPTTVPPTTVPPTTVPPTTVPPTTSNPTPTATGGTGPGASLAACQHFSDVVPPVRPAGANRDSQTQAPRVDLGGRLPAPGNVRGTLAGGAVTVSFDRVAGAVGYRVWRNAQSIIRIDDWGQANLTVTDKTPCRNANYTVVALRSDDSDASIGQLSQAYRLEDSGTLSARPLAAGTTFTYKITSYNDAGQTASGYAAGLGICAVDTRYIPWGTRLRVDGYGYCYAADIGTWIQGEIVDVWLPGGEADTWGVQNRTITVVS